MTSPWNDERLGRLAGRLPTRGFEAWEDWKMAAGVLLRGQFPAHAAEVLAAAQLTPPLPRVAVTVIGSPRPGRGSRRGRAREPQADDAKEDEEHFTREIERVRPRIVALLRAIDEHETPRAMSWPTSSKTPVEQARHHNEMVRATMTKVLGEAEKSRLFRPRLVRLEPPLSQQAHPVSDPYTLDFRPYDEQRELWANVTTIDEEGFFLAVTDQRGVGVVPALYVPYAYVRLPFRDGDGHLKLDLNAHVYVSKENKPTLRPQQHPTSITTEYIMGDKYEQNISNSNVGAAAVGPGASASGTVLTTADANAWRASIEEAQAAAVREQDKLDELAEGMYEAFAQLLRMVRQIQIDQMTAAEIQAQVKDAVDELWAGEQLKGLRSVPESTLEVLKALKGPAEIIAKVLLP